MVLEPEMIDLIEGMRRYLSGIRWRRLPAASAECVRYSGFWQCMDTMREKEKLEEIWAVRRAPWKVWK